MIKKASNKNGIVELFRFLCSIWVAHYHGFLPITSSKGYFDGVNISVDFFFLVSGLFFLRSIEKYRERPLKEGIRHIFWDRTKGFIVPLAIAALSILLCNIIFPLDFGGFNWPLSFLWFFAAQFVYLTLLFIILKNTKKRSTFNIVCIVVIAIFMSLSLFMDDSFERQFDRVFRGPAMLALGMLVSQVPKISIKAKNELTGARMTLLLNIIGFAVSAGAFAYLSYLPTYTTFKAHLFTCIICPAFLYFATSLPVHGKLFNWLGEISIFIYLAQCPMVIYYYATNKDTVYEFTWFCVCIVAMFVINRIVNQVVRKKKATT